MPQETTHPRTVGEAAAILRAGEVCAFATETVYGLGADASDSDAVLKIYLTKGRPRFNPLIVHCASIDQIRTLVDMPPLAEQLAASFWPGPLTMVLPREANAPVSDIVTAGLDTLAVRMPAHSLARDLIRAVDRPLAAPSANPSGRLSATTAKQVRQLFGDSVPVFDGGTCAAGLESTIIAVDGDRLVQLRAGATARELIEETLNRTVELASADDTVSAPGMLKSHYAPKAPMRLNAEMPEPGEAYLAFGPNNPAGPNVRNLSANGDLTEAARNLFSLLHDLDALGLERIAVAPIPETGLGEAINDRLRRAAAPRD